MYLGSNNYAARNSRDGDRYLLKIKKSCCTMFRVEEPDSSKPSILQQQYNHLYYIFKKHIIVKTIRLKMTNMFY